MLYGHDRSGTTTLMHCLAKNRLMLGEFLIDAYQDSHSLTSVLTMDEKPRTFKISNRAALAALMDSHKVIAKCHLHWCKPEFFRFDGLRIYIHRRDMVEAQLSRELSVATTRWNGYTVPSIEPIEVNIDKVVNGVNRRIDLCEEHVNEVRFMDTVLSYEDDLAAVIRVTGYDSLPNHNKKQYDGKRRLISNYDQVIEAVEPLMQRMRRINDKFEDLYTGYDNLEFVKWNQSDVVDFFL